MPKAATGTVEQRRQRHGDEGCGGDPLQQADSICFRDGAGLQSLGIARYRYCREMADAIKRRGWPSISVRGGHCIGAIRGRRRCSRQHQRERKEKNEDSCSRNGLRQECSREYELPCTAL